MRHATQARNFAVTLSKRTKLYLIASNSENKWSFVHNFYIQHSLHQLALSYVWNVNGIFLVLRKCLFFLSQVPAALTLQQYWTGQLIRSAETLSAAKKIVVESKKYTFVNSFLSVSSWESVELSRRRKRNFVTNIFKSAIVRCRVFLSSRLLPKN